MAGGALSSKEVVAAKRGGPERLAMQDVTVPRPGPGEVRVRMLAAGVAFADLMIREGAYPNDLPGRARRATTSWARLRPSAMASS